MIENSFASIKQYYLKYSNFMNEFFNGFSAEKKIIFILLNAFLSGYIVFTQFFVYSPRYVWETKFFLCAVFLSLIYTFLVFNIIVYLFYKFRHIKIEISNIKNKLDKKTFIICSATCLCVLGLTLLAYYPGGIYSDNCEQWKQVQSFVFEDWHPVIHTLIIWIITRICNNYSFVILVQITAFSLSIGYLISTLKAWGFPKICLIFIELSIVLNIMTRNIMMAALKDCTLAILLVILLTQCINVYFTNGNWFKKNTNIIAFSICFALATLVRHNAFLYTLPLLFFLFFGYRKQVREITKVVFLSITLIILIKGPLYYCLNVSRPDNLPEEIVSLPMTIMGDVMKKNPDKLPLNTKALLNKIATDEQWQQLYRCGHYGSIRFTTDSANIVKKVPVKDFLTMTFYTIKADKYDSLVAVRDITDLIWKTKGEPEGILEVQTNGQSIGYQYKDKKYNRICKIFIHFLDMAFNLPLLNMLLLLTGVHMLLLMFVGLFSYYKIGAIPLMFVVPTVIYNLGTMIFMCEDNYRYFYFNAVITFPICFVLLAQQRQKNSVE